MSGKIILVRHAHALHNVNNDTSIHDPRLTLLGQRQSVQLTKNLTNSIFKNVGCIYTSPLKRAIHTTLLAFIEVANKSFYLRTEAENINGAEVILEPLLQEVDDDPAQPANTGSDIAVLKELWPNLDFEPLQNNNWPLNQDAGERATAFLKNLDLKLTALSNAADGKRDIVVVTHGGFMQVLTASDIQMELATARKYEMVTDGGKRKLKAV